MSFRTPKVKLRRKKDGRILKVEQAEYATDLGRYKFRGYELVGETRGDVIPEGEEKPELPAMTKETVEEMATTKLSNETEKAKDSDDAEPTATIETEETKKPATTRGTVKRRARVKATTRK